MSVKKKKKYEYKAWILVHTNPLYSNSKQIAFWKKKQQQKTECILHDTGLELCQNNCKFY